MLLPARDLTRESALHTSARYSEEQPAQAYSRFGSDKYFSPGLHLRELAVKVLSCLVEIETNVRQGLKVAWKELLDDFP